MAAVSEPLLDEPQQSNHDPDSFPSIYLNILVLTGPSQAVLKEKISEKVNEKVKFSVLRTLATRTATKVAKIKVTESVVAEKMAQNIPQMMPEKMAEMGITAEAEEAFRKGAFVVIKLTLKNVDITKVVSMKAPEKAEKVSFGLKVLRMVAKWFGYSDLFEQNLTRKLNQQVASKLCEKLPQELPQKLEEKGIKVEVEARPEAEQAAYFFDALRVMH
mmetsp:Transcript_42891/g.100655  ORF Transcript_42891/g.100655 Transcript_42891/m.100655 type:complete len:217 (+) Transcript_42891:90-740(+)